MKLTALFSAALLALPIYAQDKAIATTPPKQDTPAAEPAENAMFYRAYYLERGERRGDEAIALYKKFLEAAPKSRYAGKAAANTLALLNRAGKVEEADAWKAKYADVLKNADVAGPADAPPVGDPGAGRAGGRGAGGVGGPGGGARMNLDELKKQLEKAKADGNAEEAKRLEDQIKRMEERAAGRGQGGQGGPGGQGGGRRGMGAFNKPITEMNDEEIGQMQQGLDRMGGMMTQRMRDNGQGEQADKLEAAIKKLKDSITAGKKDEAEAARLELMKLMPGRRGGGGGGR